MWDVYEYWVGETELDVEPFCWRWPVNVRRCAELWLTLLARHLRLQVEEDLGYRLYGGSVTDSDKPQFGCEPSGHSYDGVVNH